MNLFPDSASALLDELDAMFPEKVSSPETSREEDLHYGGKRDLINFLYSWRAQARGTPKGKSRVRR